MKKPRQDLRFSRCRHCKRWRVYALVWNGNIDKPYRTYSFIISYKIHIKINTVLHFHTIYIQNLFLGYMLLINGMIYSWTKYFIRVLHSPSRTVSILLCILSRVTVRRVQLLYSSQWRVISSLCRPTLNKSGVFLE